MKNKKTIVKAVLPLIIAISLFVVFNSTIKTDPSDAGFWFIFVLGMSTGVSLTNLFKIFGKKD